MKGRLQESPLIYVHAFSSISADVGNAGQSNYAAANAALSAMIQSSAQEVSPAGISLPKLQIEVPASPSMQLSASVLAGNRHALPIL